jgi:hypothetical protein
VTVTLSIANHHASLPIAYRPYLPREWADDKARRKKAHVPASIRFKTKPQIALEQIRAALLSFRTDYDRKDALSVLYIPVSELTLVVTPTAVPGRRQVTEFTGGARIAGATYGTAVAATNQS